MDDKLVVYIGAHPDDIDIGMSGSVYKFDVDKHPIMWVVVTDGGADRSEHAYDSDSERGWVKKDLNSKNWVAPDGSVILRANYSEDLVQKRCGIEFNNDRWTEKLWKHESSFGEAFDWRTRVTNLVGERVEKRQLYYSDQKLLYPDGSLSERDTESIAKKLADEIYELVSHQNYSKDLIYINSHAPDEVCTNYDANEHHDHKITGNAVRKAIDLLINRDITEIYATWFTIYGSIIPKSGYSKVKIDISGVKDKKIRLCKACWESEFLAKNYATFFYSWEGYPNNPLNFEYDIEKSYKAVKQTEEYGGPGGSPFNDREQAEQPGNTIKSIELSSGDSIDRISITYSNGVKKDHGGKGGTANNLYLDKDEYINRVSGTFDLYIKSINISTNKGNSLNGGKPVTTGSFKFEVPEDNFINGFFGRSGSLIDAIGFIYTSKKWSGTAGFLRRA
jgi:LmbE family N-acetylglucosaminyl deacetylase